MWEVQVFSGPGREDDYLFPSLNDAMAEVQRHVNAFNDGSKPDIVEIFLNNLETELQLTVVLP